MSKNTPRPPEADPRNTRKPEKTRYEKPKLTTESLTAVAALCNGTSSGGRKATVGGPPVCSASKLKS